MADFGQIARESEELPEQPDLAASFASAALGISSVIFPPAAVVKIFVDRFEEHQRQQRVVICLRFLLEKMQSLESRITDVGKRNEAKTRADSDTFREAVATAAEEAVRAEDRRKADRSVRVLVGWLSPEATPEPNFDLATMIRDLAQLGSEDLHVLAILRTVHASAIETYPNLNSSDAFSRETPALMRAIAAAKIHLDDFLSMCERLRGFGLAADVVRNISQMGPDDYCYRPTRRGLILLRYLDAA